MANYSSYYSGKPHWLNEHIDRDALKRVCESKPEDFEEMYDMERVEVDQIAPHDFYLFKDNGSKILAVAHLDTVEQNRSCNILDTAAGTVVYSGALDDRLGAYVIAELLPSLGHKFDLLFTVGEENGMSTAEFFDPAEHNVIEEDGSARYNWIIEFDRGGTDVVLYQYEDRNLKDLVEDSGARVEQGIFSDISKMEHVGVKAMNWGVGYRDYHGPKSHAWLDDTCRMVGYFLLFHEANKDERLPHEYIESPFGMGWWDSGHYRGRSVTNLDDLDSFDEAEDGCEYDDEDCGGPVIKDMELGYLCQTHWTWFQS